MDDTLLLSKLDRIDDKQQTLLENVATIKQGFTDMKENFNRHETAICELQKEDKQQIREYLKFGLAGLGSGGLGGWITSHMRPP